MEMKFQVKAHPEEQLLEELTKTLRQRTEVCSRTRYPKLWSLTDRLNGDTGARPRRDLRTAVFLFLGFVMLVPGLLEPKKLWILIIGGLVSLGYGLRLQQEHQKALEVPFRRAAQTLLEQVGSLQDDQFTVTFQAEGMTITNRVTGTMLPVPYENFECVVEAQNLYLMIYNEQVLVLVKQDLTEGTLEDLDAMLRAHVSVLSIN